MQKVKIVYKDIKNLILRVTPSLEVVLSVPRDASAKEIEYVLHKRKEWIEKKTAELRKHLPTPKELVSGEDIYYLGKRYRLKVLECKKEDVKLKGGYLEVSVADKQDYRSKQRLIKQWYIQKARHIFEEMLHKYEEILGCAPIRTMQIKMMKTRWGSCNPAQSSLNLNLRLIQKDKRAIEYVILHELAHLKHPYHNKAFYEYVGLYMPDWRERKLKLLEGM